MRIAVISDLHIDVTAQNRRLLPYLRDEIRRIAPDALVVAGDTANTLAGWNEALQQLQSLEMPKLIVPGNHDVWIESKSALRRAEDSGWKYNEALRAATVQYGWHYLPHDPIILHDIGFVGSLGWYDYSLRDPRLDASVGFGSYDEGTFIDSSRCVWVWNDTRYAVWLREPNSEDWRRRRLRRTNREVCRTMLGELEMDLNKLGGRVLKAVAAVHTNPFCSCIERKVTPDPFDAYEGSVRLGELLVKFRRHYEILAMCGHRHQPLDITDTGIRVVRSPIGYLDGFDGDYRSKASEAISVFDF